MGVFSEGKMNMNGTRERGFIKSFTFKCVIRNREVYMVEPSPAMLSYFGTTPEDYENGILQRIRKDISSGTAENLGRLCETRAAAGEDFRLMYPSMRADGSKCYIQMDAYFDKAADDGVYYTIIDMDVTDVIRAKEEADRLAAENRALLEDSPVGLGIYHITGNHFELVYTNEEYYRVHCGSREYWDSFKGKDAMSRILPEDWDTIFKEWDRVAGKKSGEVFGACYRCVGEDGRKHWIRLRARLADPVDGVRVCYAAYTNIDREKQAQELADKLNRQLLGTVYETKENEERLKKEYDLQQNYLDTMSGSRIVTMRINVTQDVVESIKDTSGQFGEDSDGSSGSGMMQKILRMMAKAEEREAFVKKFGRQAVMDAYKHNVRAVSMELYFQLPEKFPIWAKASVSILKKPDSDHIVEFFQLEDVNEEALFERITAQITKRNYSVVSYYNIRNNVFFVRDSDESLAAYNGADYLKAVDTAIMKTVQPEEQEAIRQKLSLDEVQNQLKEKELYTVYYTKQETGKETGNASLKHMKIDIFPLKEDKSIIIFLVTDVTEVFEQERDTREKMSQALAAAEQASVAKTEFLSRMSHEIRTPMNAIIGLDAIALQEKDLTTAMEDHLQKIGISARFLLSLINDILDMSRIESGRMVLKKEAFNFEDLINGINTILYEQCRDSSLDYDCVIKSFLEETYIGDFTKLQQVLINILGNAVKFTPPGGKIHFMIEQVSRTKNTAKMRFEVSDTGIGIDESFLPHLFEAFTQESRGRTSVYGGTGLGLAISKNIVNLMGGDITVHSIKDVGTSFTVDVELGVAENQSAERKLKKLVGMKSLKTLIVDDDVIVCRHTLLTLKEAGMNAEWVSSGEEALKTIKERHRDRKDYDLVLLDWKMPEMDGIETAAGIRQVVGPEVTIIIMTAFDWSDIEDKARAAGVDMFIKKPVFVKAVEHAYEEMFRKKAAPAEEKPAELDFTGFRILLAEDNEINSEIAKSILEMKNFSVDCVWNGAEAIEAFLSKPVGYYNAILMDVRMPVMDGLEAARSIRAMKKEDSRTIPILAMTANAFQEDANLSLESGMTAHLAKPIEPQLLYHTLGKYLLN